MFSLSLSPAARDFYDSSDGSYTSLDDFFHVSHTICVCARAGCLCGFLLRNAQFPYLHCIVLLACVHTRPIYSVDSASPRAHLRSLLARQRTPSGLDTVRMTLWYRSKMDITTDDRRRDDDAHLKKYRKHIGSKHFKKRNKFEKTVGDVLRGNDCAYYCMRTRGGNARMDSKSYISNQICYSTTKNFLRRRGCLLWPISFFGYWTVCTIIRKTCYGKNRTQTI